MSLELQSGCTFAAAAAEAQAAVLADVTRRSGKKVKHYMRRERLFLLEPTAPERISITSPNKFPHSILYSPSHATTLKLFAAILLGISLRLSGTMVLPAAIRTLLVRQRFLRRPLLVACQLRQHIIGLLVLPPFFLMGTLNGGLQH